MTNRVSQRMARIAGALGLIAIAAQAHAGDVAVSVNVNAPGIYGQITLGGLPAPELILPRPVVAVPAQVVLDAEVAPLYLHVPPGYERHWSRHCREYQACDRPVYFVSEHWYNNVYVPRRHDEDGQHEWREHEYGHEHGYDHDRKEERHEEHAREHERKHEEHEHEHGHDRDEDR